QPQPIAYAAPPAPPAPTPAPIPPPAAPIAAPIAPPVLQEPVPQPVPRAEPPRVVAEAQGDFPGAEDRPGLEAALQNLMRMTGCRRAELHVVGPDQTETVVEVGPNDALLASLVGLARSLGGPQVVGGLTGQQEGKAWGAWPFRTVQRHGVI